MTDLKPCPFCGSKDVHLIENDRGKSEVSITCKDCNVWVDHMFDAMSKEEAIELWNRRANECSMERSSEITHGHVLDMDFPK